MLPTMHVEELKVLEFCYFDKKTSSLFTFDETNEFCLLFKQLIIPRKNSKKEINK